MKTQTRGIGRAVCILLAAVCMVMAAVPAFAENVPFIRIDPNEQHEERAEYAVIEAIEGELTHEGQKDVYTLKVPEDGWVRLEMGELYGNARVTLKVYNRLGECVHSRSYAGNGDGITMKGLKAGEEYEIRVCQEEKLSNYVLYIGMPKAMLDISDITVLVDSIEYTDQRNPYTFTVEQDGIVRFEFAEMRVGIRPTISVFNRLGEEVATRSYAGNGNGVTLKDLKAGETYTVIVFFEEGYGEYTLLIGKPKAPVDCGTGVIISDSIEYTNQSNLYRVSVKEDGDMIFTINEMPYGNRVIVAVYNRLGECVGRHGFWNNGGIYKLKNVKAGEVYEVRVEYEEGFCGYELRID